MAFSNQKNQVSSFKFDTILGSTTTIEGNLQQSGNIRVDGKVIGNISPVNGNELVVAISEGGVISGNIQCHHLIVSGTVIGNVNASYKVEILDHAKIEGDVAYSLLSMTPGATIDGRFVCNLAQTEIDSKNLLNLTIQHQQ